MSVDKKSDSNDYAQSVVAKPDRAAVVAIAAGIRTCLQFHQQLGIKQYPLTPDLQQCLARKQPHAKEILRPQAPQPLPLTRPEKTPPIGTAALAEQFTALHREIEVCRLCTLATSRQGQVIGGGTIASRLLIIGDYSSQTTGFSTTNLFGAAEDAMLWNMMRAIGLSPEEVYVTNTVKCCPLPTGPPETEQELRCLAYLRREIELIGPRIICAMGESAARSVLEGNEPVARLRGRFHRYRYSKEGADPIQIMVTFHPRFLLECADMKKAAWLDLQAIQRLLQTL
ncbi:MAG: uracil-DNA glycosylase [Desulfobulbaceae bacterium]|nr:uracil-DNA glycosylase [Desulfobulbaceae bacterium]